MYLQSGFMQKRNPLSERSLCSHSDYSPLWERVYVSSAFKKSLPSWLLLSELADFSRQGRGAQSYLTQELLASSKLGTATGCTLLQIG